MDKRKLSPSSVPSRRPPVSILLAVLCRAFAINEAAKSNGILIFFWGSLQFPPGQPQGGSLSCLRGLGGRIGAADEVGCLGGRGGAAEEVEGGADGILRLGWKVNPAI